MLIAADSLNVAAVSEAAGTAGAVCLTVAAPVVRNAVVTLHVNESGGPSGHDAFVALRDDVAPYLDNGACPPGTNVVVYMVSGTTATTMEFYALFN